MPKGFTEEERAIIIERLLTEAQRAFGRYGVRKTSVEEICSAAGIAKGSFYSFFPSKEELFMQAMERKEQEVREQFARQVRDRNLPPREQLREFLWSFMTICETDEVARALITPETVDYLMRKLPPERAIRHQEADAAHHLGLFRQWEEAGARFRISPELFPEVIKALFYISMHRDLPGFAYKETMNFLIDAVTDAIFEHEEKE